MSSLPSEAAGYLTLFAISESVTINYLLLFTPRDMTVAARQLLLSSAIECGTWDALAPIGDLACQHAGRTLWLLFLLCLLWEALLVWTAINGVTRLNAKLLATHLMQGGISVPLMLFVARHAQDPVVGVLASFRIFTCFALLHNVLPLAREDPQTFQQQSHPQGQHTPPHRIQRKVSSLGASLGAAGDDEEHDGAFLSPKHRPWAASGSERDSFEERGYHDETYHEPYLLSDLANFDDSIIDDRMSEDMGETPGDLQPEPLPYHDMKVIFSYLPEDSRMLELREGETVRCVAEQDGWLFALDCEGNEGFVPPSYVEPVHDDEDH